MKTKILFLVAFSMLQINLFAQSNKSFARELLTLDKGWRFHLGDIAFPVITGHSNTYQSAKAGKAWGAAAPDFDDALWRVLNLPHDWAVEGAFDSIANVSQGYRNRGFGWYRRSFKLSPEDNGKHIELQFDGIATNATIWVNGTLLHRNWCGYTSMYIDITPYAVYGENINIISVRVDANAQEGWWYEGAGMYRHTWLLKRSALHIKTDGVYAHPVKKNKDSWGIPVEVTLNNSGKTLANSEVEVSVFDASGKLVVQAKKSVSTVPLRDALVSIPLSVNNPTLWSVDSPVLYTVKTVVRENGIIVDNVQTKCGFRTVRFDANTGFYLNDKNIKLKGVCNHQDHAGVGVAVPDAMWEFRLRKLKEMGVNAYRCSHNPPAKEFLDACDSMGILVMDENRNFNSSPEYVNQLEWMVRRDRNRPSIILWSVFNEEPMQGTENGYEMVRRMADVVKQLDTTRAVTAAMNGGFFTPINVSQAVDVVGINYQRESYDSFHKAYPQLKLTSSEDVSAFQVRGEYKTDKSKNIIDAYDTQGAPWGSTHRVGWKAVAERPYLAGCFVWTGFDYRGEPSPFKWPSASSVFGIMDLCGFPKMAYYLHQAQWVENKPILNLVPHWNWPSDSIGKPIKVMALSNADSIVLKFNGKILSSQRVDKYEMNTWMVPYNPGILEAIGYKKGKMVSSYKVETTSEALQLKLTPYRPSLSGNGTDAMPITVEVVDSKGRPVPTANIPVEFTISGPVNIIGLGNGNPTSHEAEKGNKRSLFNGLAQVIIQSSEQSGSVVLTAISAGIKSTSITIPVNVAEITPFVPIINSPIVLDKWITSPQSKLKPNPNQQLSENDMNSWETINTGAFQKVAKDNYVIWRTKFTPREAILKNGGKLILKQTAGVKEVWIDGKLTNIDNPEKTDIAINIPQKKKEMVINVLMKETNQQVGIGGVATVLE
ncbi:MAG: beta-galactosidase GalA [Paludibacter sp.]